MLYAKIDNEKNILDYPLTLSDIRKAIPNVSFPASQNEQIYPDFSEYGYVQVAEAAAPTISPTQKLLLDTPVWKNGHLIRTFKIIDANDQEISEIKERCINFLATHRYEYEVKGTSWGEYTIPTDRESQSKYNSELLAISLGVRKDGEIWKLSSDVFLPMTNDQMKEISIKAREHVKDCFTAEGLTSVQIYSGQVVTYEDVRNKFKLIFDDIINSK